MIAYKKEWLDNLQIQEDLKTAIAHNYITKDEKENAESLYPSGFYSPNPFIRIGLFILTFIIVFFSIGLGLIITNTSNEKGIGILFIFFSCLTYISLELIIKYKKHYKSGVDDALLWLSGIGFIIGLNLLTDISEIVNTLIILFITFYFFIRFTNAIMDMISAVSFLVFAYILFIASGNFFQSFAGLIVAVTAGFLYFYSKKMYQIKKNNYYRNGLFFIEIASLICMYGVVNYFFVKQQPINFLKFNIAENNKIQFGWLYWLLTIAVPLIYMFKGIQKKDRILLRIGMILVPALIFTIRFYHAILAVEFAMLIGGIVLLGVAYTLIKHLHQPKYGFTSKEIKDTNFLNKLNIEAIIVAGSFNNSNSAIDILPEDNRSFGGGDFGGGGASTDF